MHQRASATISSSSMGVNNLWQTLQGAGAVRQIDGTSPTGDVLQVLRQIDSKRIAVDLSIWLFEGQLQLARAAAYDNNGVTASVKLVFERIIAWLRHGVTPVLVLDGQVAQAKTGRIQQRFGLESSQLSQATSSSRQMSFWAGYDPSRLAAHTPCANVAASLAKAMGVPVIQAISEAEAMCAALNAAGLVDSVQSRDVDTLLFGAHTVFKQLKLSVANQKQNEVQLCELERVRQDLGLRRGGVEALQCLGALAGGDYNIKGVDRVGTARAYDAVRALIKQHGKDDDTGLTDLLRQLLAEGPDPHVLSLTNCTGCRLCGHESGTKSRKDCHGKTGCAECGTSSGCVAAPANQECQCEFHRLKYERVLSKVLERAQQHPDVIANIHAALDEYKTQADMAATAVKQLQPGNMRWQKRPDCQAVSQLLRTHTEVHWSDEVVRLKLRPIMMEWDLLQGPRTADPLVEWRPLSIQKVAGLNTLTDEEAWRVVLQLERLPGRGTPQEEEQDRAWLSGVVPRQLALPTSLGSTQPSTGYRGDADEADAAGGEQEEQEEDEEEEPGFRGTQGSLGQAGGSQRGSVGGLSSPGGSRGSQASGRAARRSAPPDQRTFRISLIAAHWPQVIRDFQQAKAAKLAKSKSKASTPKSKASTSKVAASGGRGRSKVQPKSAGSQGAISSFFKTQQAVMNEGTEGQGSGDEVEAVKAQAKVGVSDPTGASKAMGQAPGAKQQVKQVQQPLAGFMRERKGGVVQPELLVSSKQRDDGPRHQQHQPTPIPSGSVRPGRLAGGSQAAGTHSPQPGVRVPVIDLVTPSPPQQRQHAQQHRTDAAQVIYLSDSDDDQQEAGARAHPVGTPSRVRPPAVASPNKRSAPQELASPAKAPHR